MFMCVPMSMSVWVGGCELTHNTNVLCIHAYQHMHIIRTGSDKCSSENIEEESATHSPTKVPAIHGWEILTGDDMHG